MPSISRPPLPDSVSIVLPPEWIEVPLDALGQQRFVEGLVRAAEPGTFDTAARRQLELLVSNIARLARERRVIIASSFVAAPETDDDELIAAVLAVTALERRALGTDLPLVGEVLLASLGSVEHRAQGFAFNEIEPPALVQLAEREAVKLIRLVTFSDGQGHELKQFEQTYLLPVADGDGLIVLQFGTINFGYARQFSELFEKIAGTVRLLHPEDPTFDPEPAG